MAELESTRVALDTCVFIYYIEEHPHYIPLVEPIFAAAFAREHEIVTSALTLLEVLVVPLRAGNVALAKRFEAVLTRSRGLRMIDVTRDQLRAAALLRARHGVRTPDALQLAAAVAGRCATFITNDRALPQIPGLRVIQLGDYVRAEGRAT